MGLDTDKLVFLKKYQEAGSIMVQSKTGSAKMYPTTRENIIELAKRGKIDNLKTYFTPESIEAAQSEEEEKSETSKKPANKNNKGGKNSKNNEGENSGEAQK